MDDSRQELLRAWLTKAANDLRGARILGDAEDDLLDTAIYHCQQAAEKSVKAFLVRSGVTPEKTHDVRRLTIEATVHEPRFDELLEKAAALTPYAWEFRYPDDLAETYPTREEFEEAYEQARFIHEFVLNLIPAKER
jgi:HEPN domain-containing protein